MKIYTKVGDGGNTFLFGGKKVRKDDPRVNAYGEVDELNAALGLARATLKSTAFAGKIDLLQRELFVLGAELARPPGAKGPRSPQAVGPDHVARLEREIDVLAGILPPLKNFILPGGSPAGAALHLARTTCRRAERAVVTLAKKQRVGPQDQIYLNRLSDYLFMLARAVNAAESAGETPWIP
jgi:cob(I)alamin adenosyltransferase